MIPPTARRHYLRCTIAMTMLLFLYLPHLASSTVVLPEYNRSFSSMPALFGGEMSSHDPSVTVHLMFLKDMPLMCQEEIDEYKRLHNDGRNVSMDIEIPAPDDGLPVALLVQRGKCTFYEKAVVASRWESVKYIIVYDNEMSPELVPMSSEYAVNMTLFFVSYVSGHEMKDLILRKMTGGDPNDPVTSGILVELDGVSPVPAPPAPELNWAAYVLAAMSGFLAFLIFFGCILMCAQMGFIVAQPDEHGRIVLFAGGQGARNLASRMIRNNLLTHDQVMALDEEEFQRTEGEEEDAVCCAICLEEFEDKEKVRILPCKHHFHEDCLVPWLTERHSSCPLCKFDVMQHVLDRTQEGKHSRTPVAEIANVPDDNYQDENATSAPMSLWTHLWGFRGWTVETGDHQHQILDNVSSEDDEEGQINVNSEGSTIREIEMETRTSSNPVASVTVVDGAESTLVP